MPSLSLKIILEDGAVTRTMKFPSDATVADATLLVEEKILTGAAGKDYGLFLTSADDDLSGIWLEDPRRLDYYLIKDGDSLHYRCRVRTLRIRMLDGSLKTMQVDERQPVEDLMLAICSKLGITNYEEYGLCREDQPMEQDAPATGTLTLKRKAKPRERDAAMQQLSKKLKTDDNVEWLEQRKTLRESTVAPTETLLLKRRLFYSDRKVDARDPVQLNLLYVQARDAVLQGRHPVTEEQAVQFAGIQCQVQYGDFQEDKHKPGYIENLSEFLPQQYANAWGVEKKVLREHSHHVGVTPIEAKHLYTKTARDLPTYGVTFFLVKEMQKGKKKLVPRLLGINANAILRLDETTKEVLQVWPLTQVKTYKAGKGELFTLNFGDYSEKEYCVKTNDAYRIRDILQSYIDLIRKKMAGPYNPHGDEGGVVYSSTVESSKGQTMEVVSHSSHKGVETSFVGPSKIISYESGSTVQSQGAQVMTAQQVIVTSRQHNEQTASTGGVAMRGEMSVNTVRKLNDLNGNAVCIVKLLTEPTEANIEEAKKIVGVISQNMPVLVEGVKQHIEKQPDEPARKKLSFELSELTDNVNQLTKFKSPSDAQEAAMKIADLTTQMYFALDPRSKRNSKILRHSRKSFIEDDRTQATIHRASFINAVAAASNAIDDAKDILNKKHTGAPLSPEQIEALERSARDRLAKLNAAIALFAAAHSDPSNIDYGAAVNSMNTIKEIMPELAKDALALSGAQDGRDRSALLQEMRDLCEAAEAISQKTGCADLEKLHDEANNFAKKSGRLIFTFGRGVHPDKENEIIALAKEADDKASLLMATANQLAGEVNDPGAEAAARAAARCGHAARGLRACAQLTASSIHEPHCRSALSAASEDLKSSGKLLTDACRPLLDHPEGRSRSEDVARQSAELAKALERLENAYSELDGKSDTDGNGVADRERRRLRFVTTLSKAQDAMDNCDKILKDDAKSPAPTSNNPTGWYKLAELNAAIASLLAATRDGENPNYAAADEALAIIEKSLPELVKESKAYSQKLPPQQRAEFLCEVQALCDAARALVLDKRHGEDAGTSVAEFARASGKLTYILDKHAQADKEHEIIDLAKSSCVKTSELLAHVYGLAADLQGEAILADDLDAKGSRVAEAAEALLTTAQLTAPTIHTAPCKRALLDSAQTLSSALEDVAKVWSEACQSNHQAEGQVLKEHRKVADEEIERLIAALRNLPEYEVPKDDVVKAKKRVQFATSLSYARDAVEQAEMEIDRTSPARQLSTAEVTTVRRSLADKLATLNAAIASLMTATQDPLNPDFEAAQSSSAIIQQLVPQLVQETKALSGNTDDKGRAELLDELRVLCAAAKAISTGAGDGNSAEVKKAVAQYANAAGRLTFICTPQTKAQGNQRKVLDKTQAVCERSSELMAVVQQLEKPGTSSSELEGPRLKAQRAAQALRTTAQLTAPSLHTTQCRTALHDAASDLSHAVSELGNACGPQLGQAGLQRIAQQRKEFEKAVEELMRTMKDLEGDTQADEKRRLKFMTTQAVLDKAARELSEPVKSAPLTPPQAEAMQASLSDRLATLNAAIAALLSSTRDPSNLNNEVAETSSAVIQELVPQLVKDSKALSGSLDQKRRAELLGEVQALCAAAKALSAGASDANAAEMNKAVDQYAKAAGRLSFICTPQNQAKAKQHKVMEKTQAVCDKSSELMAVVEQLKKPGTSDAELEGPRFRAQQAAKAFLTTAQLTAPTLHATQCRSTLHQAASDLSQAVSELGNACGPQLGQAGLQRIAQQRKEFEKAVEELMRTMKDLEGHTQADEKQRLKFMTTQAVLDKAARELSEPVVKSAPLTPPQVEAMQASLSARLATLNAAIAALLSSTRDPSNLNYEVAESSSAVIQDLVPQLVKDSKALSGSLDQKRRAELLGEVQALCAAAKALSAGANDANAAEMNKAVDQYAKAAGRLFFICAPQNQAKAKQHKVLEKTQAVCDKSSELMAVVEQLKKPGTSDAELEGPKLRAQQAAKALLTTAQLTAPTLHATQCRSTLHQAASDLSQAVSELGNACGPQLGQAGLQRIAQQRKEFEKAVEELMRTMKDLEGDTQGEKKRNLNLVTATQAVLDQAARELKEPAVSAPLNPLQEQGLQSSLSARLATLNAAIAALVSSTRDPSKLNYEVANSSTAVIQELVPQFVQDSKTLSGSMDPKRQAQLLDAVQALCAAAKALSAGTSDDNATEMKKAVDQYAGAAGRLSIICTPQKQVQQKQDMVLFMAKPVLMCSSELIAVAQQLQPPGTSDPELEGPRLRAQQAEQAFRITTQLTAPTLHATECRSMLHEAASDLSLAVAKLSNACSPRLDRAGQNRLAQTKKEFEIAVEELMRSMKDFKGDARKSIFHEKEKRHYSFTDTKPALEKAASELNKPISTTSLTQSQTKALQSSLSDRLATLNAAIAALISSTRDDQKPDYAVAVNATIQKLVPGLVEDSRILAGELDKVGKDDLVRNLQDLCYATKVLSSGGHSRKEEELNEAVERFTKASGKLAYTFNPDANYALQDQIIDLTKSTCLKTSEMLAHVYDLAEQVRGSKGEELDAKGAKVADAAQNLLTTAEITVPSITSPLCRSSCVAAVDALDSSVQDLALAWQSAASQKKTEELETAKAKVADVVKNLREALKSIKEPSHADFGPDDAKTQALAEEMRYLTCFGLAEAAVEAAKKELDKPFGSQPSSAVDVWSLENSLAQRLGDLNAVVGSIVVTPRDPNKVNYAQAHTAAAAIRELVPGIVRDTKTLSVSKDPKTRDELLTHARALGDATLELGASTVRSPDEVYTALPQYFQASGSLNSVFNPKYDKKKAEQIMDACESTWVKTSDLMKDVLALPPGEGGAKKKLEEKGQVAFDAAKRLLTAGQLTAPSAESAQCQAVLFEASHQVSASLKDVESAAKSSSAAFPQDPRFKAFVEQMTKDHGSVEAQLAQLRALLPAVKDVKAKKPAVPVRSGSLKRRGAAAAGAANDFMDEMRSALGRENAGGTYEAVKSPTAARSAADKQAKAHFGKCVELARESICKSENDLKKTLSSPVKPRASLDGAQAAALNKQMEHKLARANAAAAHLLACRGSQKPDYQLASKCVVAVSDLIPTIVIDAKTLADWKEEPARTEFLKDTIGLCDASKNLCDTAKNDKKKLTEAALLFGNQTSKLLYAVSTDVDPSQENDVLSRVKAVGDVACRVTAAADGAEEQDAAVRCAAQATLFMYTAKLVAPSIQDPECQDSLITASKDLSAQLKVIPTTNRPEVAKELTELEKLLEALRRDVEGGQLVKKRETLTIEDTPLRRLTAQVIEDAKQNAECTSRPADERRAMADFANKLTDALKDMDLANARCKNAPQDMKRRADLEDAVLNVQQLVMLGRPRHGATTPQSNIVDLAVFLGDVSSAAQQLGRSAGTAERACGPHARAAAAVAAQCQELGAAVSGPGVDVDRAAKECTSRVQKINTAIECCAESPEKSVLRKEARPLNESSTILQFASQSSIATTQCAAIDEALNDLTELEHRIDRMLQPREGEGRTAVQAPTPALLSSRARLATAAAGARRAAQELAPAFTRYVADMRAGVDVADDDRRRRLADHLKKLHDRLKLLTMETGRQVVTWRPENQGEVVSITEDILKELDNAEAVIQAKPSSTKSHIAYEDLKKLLLPVNTYKVEGDKKQLEAKLESSATKLNSMTETITLSARKGDSLARTAHLTAETALQLSAIAKSLKSDEDPTNHIRIEEASQELCFVTYNLLKTAESASQDPDSLESRRRLKDACRSLTDAINKLVRTASTADKLQRDCNELSRSLQLRQSCLQARPTCALPYAECVAALQTQHGVIENLKSDKPMSRQEFSSSLDLLASAVSNNVEYAEQCAYLLSISEQHPALAKEGLFDAERARRLLAAAEETCFRVTRPGIEHQAKEESSILSKQLSDLKQGIQECSSKVPDAAVKQQLLDASSRVEAAGVKLQAVLNTNGVTVDKLTPPAFAVIDALAPLRAAAGHPSLAPLAAPSAPAQQRADEVIHQTKELLSRSTALMRVVKSAESQEAMTWVMFNTYTKGVIESSDQLVTCIRNNGQNAGLVEGAIEDEEADLTTKSYVQTQALIANKWLHKPSFKAQIKTDGETAAKNVIDVGKKMMEHLKGAEREEMRHLVEECEQLLKQCSAKYDLETGSVLTDRLKDLAKSIDRCVVNMVVEDLIEDEEPLADLEILIDAERDEAKRKFVLERKIKDLLAHLGRVTKTARVVADGHGGDGARELRQCTEQASLLAPMLVKAAEKRVIHPTEKAVVEEYQTQLAQYSQSLSRVRDLCDRAVDPMQFVQTAEETMQRMKEESAADQHDLQKCSDASIAIRKLAHRVINVSMSSPNAQRDPELMKELAAAQQRLRAAEPQRALRASKLPDWRSNIAEILRATGEVESVLGGEMIFQKLPEPDQPIYNAARNLHAAVREWSARDNEIVAVAKRSAVLMAKLSDHMHADKKREVLSTSKAIVAASHEVARLARKLALECTDMRIRTNLLQVCDQIPTISGQLKMLTTVKGSSLGHQGTEEDIEAMNMLVGNAQNLMMSIQDVVNAAAGASVKIRSQRGGPRMRWVRKNYQ